MEGEGLGDLVTCSDVRQTEGRHMESGARSMRNLKKPFLYYLSEGRRPER